MTDPSIALRPIERGDLDRVEALLAAGGLPTDDVRAKPECFFLACDGDAVVGAGGLEAYGSDGLLRSIVVAEPYRGRGYGGALCDALEDRARERGVGELYLLTTIAAGFFRRRGYETIDREVVPPAVRQTTEFVDLCPDSATCMRLDLG